jgi:short-subunit dehydrogenase
VGVELAGSRVLVTGASSGIGAVTAVLLAERGATVGLVARRPERLDAVLRKCQVHAPASRRWAADLNFLSPTQLTLRLLPRMVAAGRGVVVNVSSLAGRVGVPGEPAYSASKFALCGWTESLAIELAGTGVDVRLVLPGAIDTDIWDLPDNDPPVYDGPKEPPETVAEAIAAAIEGDRFETYVPDLKAVVELKTSDADTYLAAAVGFRDGEAPPPPPDAD